MPGGPREPTPTESWSRWPNRTGRSGTTSSSPKALRCSTAPWAKSPVGEYRIQAAIAALHDQAPTAEETDWPQILALYGLLEEITGNPIVTLNRAVAAAMAEGPAAGLALLEEVDERLAGHYRLDAVRAHLLEMAGDTEGALSALSRRGKADDEPHRTALPGHPGGSPQVALRERAREPGPQELGLTDAETLCEEDARSSHGDDARPRATHQPADHTLWASTVRSP